MQGKLEGFLRFLPSNAVNAMNVERKENEKVLHVFTTLYREAMKAIVAVVQLFLYVSSEC